MAAPSDNGFAANVNDPTAAGGMAATDVTQASGQAKTREFLTTHRFNNPEDGCHIYIYMYVYMCMFICIYIYVYMYVWISRQNGGGFSEKPPVPCIAGEAIAAVPRCTVSGTWTPDI